ncbi:hypothetical protein QOT17_002129 [Balamuthia mandrillaris]
MFCFFWRCNDENALCNIGSCEIPNKTRFRHTVGSLFAGILFAIGWALWLDAALISNRLEGYHAPPWWFYLPGPFATVILLLMNMVSLNDLRPSSLLSSEVSGRVKVWLFFVAFLVFGCLTMALWMSIDEYKGYTDKSVWPGVALVLQSVIILISSLLLMVARAQNEEEMEAFI